jgi:hypothetical protein
MMIAKKNGDPMNPAQLLEAAEDSKAQGEHLH